MRRFLQRNRWVTALVGCLLLFATSGLSLSRMTCLAGGHSVLSFGQADDCCPAEEASDMATVKADCCAYTQAALERVNGLQSPPLHLDVFFVEASIVLVQERSAQGELPARWVAGGPPPLSAPQRLAHLGVLLV